MKPNVISITGRPPRAVFTPLLAGFMAIAALPSLASASSLFYVSDSGNLNAQVFTGATFVTNPILYGSGQLAQTSVNNMQTTSADGLLFDPAAQTFDPQHADASASDTAGIGSLHAVATANSITNGYPNSGNVQPGTANGMSSIHLEWSDTVFFQTSNPAGSDFTATLTLDDSIANSITFDPNVTFGSVGGRVSASISVPSLPSIPTVFIADSKVITFDGGTTVTPPATRTVTFNVHVFNDQAVTFLGTLDVVAIANGAEAGDRTDVSDTAEFGLTTSDSLASYRTASGVVFVPEPGSLALIVAAVFFGLLTTLVKKRGKSHEQNK